MAAIPALAAACVVAGGASAQAAVFTSDERIVVDTDADCPSAVQGAASPYGTGIDVALHPGARVTSARVTLRGIDYAPLVLLRALLVAPNGEHVLVMHGAAGSGGTPPGVGDLTFDDDASGPVPDTLALAWGAHKPTTTEFGCSRVTPEEPLPAPAPQSTTYPQALSALAGARAAGTWRLYIAETHTVWPERRGLQIAGWSLDLDHTDVATCEPAGPIQTTAPAGVDVRLDCADPDGDPLTYSIERRPQHGTLGPIDQATGTVTYTPASGYAGPDSFTYAATDADGRSNVATISVTVNPAAVQPPAATPPVPELTSPAPTPPPPAPQPIARPIAPATISTLPGARQATRVIQRMSWTRAGRYTLILRDRSTGKRLRWLAGSRIGGRTLTRTTSAPVLTTDRPGRRQVINARVAAPVAAVRAGRVQMRVVLKEPSRPLSDAHIKITPAGRP